jgi:hypothetical protein
MGPAIAVAQVAAGVSYVLSVDKMINGKDNHWEWMDRYCKRISYQEYYDLDWSKKMPY